MLRCISSFAKQSSEDIDYSLVEPDLLIILLLFTPTLALGQTGQVYSRGPVHLNSLPTIRPLEA